MKLHIVKDDGELVETIDLNNYDLGNTVAKRALIIEILEAVERGESTNG